MEESVVVGPANSSLGEDQNLNIQSSSNVASTNFPIHPVPQGEDRRDGERVGNPSGGDERVEKLIGDDSSALNGEGIPRLEVGMEFESDEAARAYYSSYARKNGFEIRCSKHRKSERSGEVVSRKFVCCRQGFCKEQKVVVNKNGTPRKRSNFRLGCKAMILVTKNKAGRWEMRRVEKNHNHEMFTPRKMDCLQSHRVVSDVAKSMFQSYSDAGLPHKKAMKLYTRRAGASNVDHLERDDRNLIDGMQWKKLEEDDANTVYSYFNLMQAQNPHFSYAFEGDSKGHLKNVFWADPRSKMAYHYFGDVVTFDTTYRNNRYDKPFAPFTGVNHHGQYVLFGCALLLDETEASFVWLFETWLRAMCGRPPVSIITNQDSALIGAITRVFPETRHRLCWRHIVKKFQEKLPLLWTKGSEFKKELKKCIKLSQSIEEFEKGWESILEKYKLKENNWLQSLYLVRDKWVPIYFQGMFFAGMNSTEQRESINYLFDDYITSRTSLYEFVIQYARAIDSQFEGERYFDLQTSNFSPMLHSHMKLERHAAEVYTQTIFYKFQKQLDDGLNHTAEEVSSYGENSTYSVSDDDGKDKSTYIVSLNKSISRATCSCHFFESSGILCCHILKIFTRVDIRKIPDHYILKRWTKNAKSGAVFDEHGVQMEDDNTNQPVVLRRNHVLHRFNKLAEDVALSTDIYYEFLIDLAKMEEKYAAKSKGLIAGQNSINEGQNSTNIVSLHDTRAETKGRKRNVQHLH